MITINLLNISNIDWYLIMEIKSGHYDRNWIEDETNQGCVHNDPINGKLIKNHLRKIEINGK